MCCAPGHPPTPKPHGSCGVRNFSPVLPLAPSIVSPSAAAPDLTSDQVAAAVSAGDQSADALTLASPSGPRVDAMEEQPSGLNIADTIFRELRRQILVGELSAGQRLPGERDLAIQYGTNRNTLREAVRKLEQARLVTVRHGQGVTISDFKKTGTMDLLSPMLESGGSPADLMHILEDILPARELVLEFSTRLAVRRADRSDIDRLTGITELLVTAFETKDGALVGKGFHRWLEALIDAGHSTAIRWISNPFLEAYRDILERYPALWVLESSFPHYLRETLAALIEGDEEHAIQASREYYQRVDREFVVLLKSVIKPNLTPSPPTEPESP